ncbi:unnamed protein product [Rodentolepis nana]|uniref:BHLH domain-containing protein n=1 Tax=Rodentolepis nana TaxID=102285 RepID=A0A0R3TUU3_RODNA|nr:unnamed protein product [Rodentolepis nana]
MIQSTVSHQMQPCVQPSFSQLSDRTMPFHISNTNRLSRRGLGGKCNGLEKVCFTNKVNTILKLPKPQMEKKRRERINASLEMLRHLVAEPILKQGAEKLEKADILELTVQYLQSSASRHDIHSPYPVELKRNINLLFFASDKPWIQWINSAWTYFLAGYTSCEEKLRHFVESTVSINYSGVEMASLVTTIESQKLQAVHNFVNALAQQFGSSSKPPTSSTETNATLMSKGRARERSAVWRPW